MAQTINLNTTPGGYPVTLFYSQGDIGREFNIKLASSDGYVVPSGATVKMVATKPSGFGFEVTGTLSNGTASFTTTETMTNEAGRFPAEIRIIYNNNVIGTANFFLEGERDPHPEGTTDGDAETIIPELTLLVERVETAASSVLDMQVEVQTLAAGSQATYSYDEDTNTQTWGIPQGEAGAGAAGTLANAYSSSATYAVGDYVLHNSNLYICTTAITTAESFTAAHWSQVVLADGVSDLKSDLNNVESGSSFIWELGTLTPNTGAEQTGTTRVRSKFIPVTTGTEITLATPNNRLLVYCFDSSKSYVSDSPWLSTNKFTVTDTSVAFVRILIRKDTSNSSISSEEIETLVQDLAVAYVLPKSVYTEMPTLDKLKDSLDGSRYLRNIEIGSMSSGKPTVSTAYIRSADFIRVHKGDVFRATPIGFGLYYGNIYIYDTDNESGYDSAVTIPTVTTGNTWEYAFPSDCWIKFRVSNKSSGALITPQDLYTFNDTFYLEHLYDADELLQSVEGLSIDYDTLNGSISGNFNLAIQTDTHMAKYVGYTGSEYAPSNFDDLKSVVNSINLLDIDVFAHLGDFIRGYQCDPGYESRETADAMLECYRGMKTNKAFVIGNHDDGCLFYSNATYNDNPSTQQVMFPNEQFNRYVKFGLNNKGVSNYYYADIDGVRVITLYQRDFDYSSAIPQIEAFNIGADQLLWLTNTALDTELPVIILTHAPLLASLYATSRGGFDDVLTALTSFISNGGTVIAVLSGHTHAQNTAKVDGINHIVFKNGYNLFELVSVDLVNRTISCKAINGSTPDLSLTY